MTTTAPQVDVFASTGTWTSATLTADTVATVTVSEDYPNIKVINGGAAALDFTIDGDAPTVGGGDYSVAAGQSKSVQPGTALETAVKIISASAISYTVIGY